MAEEQATHRRSEEKAEGRRAFFITVTGQVLGAIIILAVLFLAWRMIERGQQLTALGTVLVALGSLVSVYFYGKSKNNTDSKVIELSEEDTKNLLRQLQKDQKE